MTRTNTGTSLHDRFAALVASTPEAIADPYPLYARLREEAPVFPYRDQVVVSAFDPVTRVLLDPSRFLSGTAELRGSRVQASLATVFLLISQLGKGSTVEHAYLVLLDTQLLVYFVPYLYLFLCLLRQARRPAGEGLMPGGRVGATIAGMCGFAVTAFAMIVAAIPPGDAPSRAVFALKVIGGAAAFVVLGMLIYLRARQRR